MTATAKQWKRYQAVRASLEPDQQNVLSEIEFYMSHTEPGVTLAEVEVFSDYVSDWRGRHYSPATNHRFLAGLGKVNIGVDDQDTAHNLFDWVRLRRGPDGWRLKIRPSEYFSEVIGAYIRDKEEE
jgi:hypothetical protein